MSAIRMRARADIHARPVSVVVLVALVGITGGAVLAGLAGAERTASAYDRYRATYRPPHAFILEAGFFSASGIAPADAAQLPQVQDWASYRFGPAQAFTSDGDPLFFEDDPEASIIVAPEGSPFTPRVLEGRLPQDPDEVAISWGETSGPRAEVGDEIGITLFSARYLAQHPDVLDSAVTVPKDAYLPIRATVVGVVLPWADSSGSATDLYAGAGFTTAHPGGFSVELGAYRLRRGLDDLEGFLQGVRKADPGTFTLTAADEVESARRSARFPSLVASLFAVFLAITALLVVGQAIVRRTAEGALDDPILRSLGMTRRQVVASALVVPAVVGIIGSIMSVAFAYALSPLFPVGTARLLYEPDPGPAFDGGVLLVGAALIFVVPVAMAFVPAWRLSRARGGVGGTIEYAGADRPSGFGTAIGRLGLPIPLVVGARMALEPGHGRSAAPVRSTIAGLAIAVTAAVAALVFSASMDHVAATPRLWGADFEFGTGFPFGEGTFEHVAIPVLMKDPGLADLSVGNFQQSVGVIGPSGRIIEVNAWGLERARGAGVSPTMITGRWPQGPDEIALASHTIQDVGVQVGDHVTVKVGDLETDMTVVGVPVFPDVGFGPGLGEGAGILMDALRRFYPDDSWLELALGNYLPGVSVPEVNARLNLTLSGIGAEVSENDVQTLGTTVEDATSFARVPLGLSFVFGVAALGTLAHVLLTLVRRRRRDLAVLRTLGLVGRQVVATVGWQAVTLVVVGFALGAPLGLLLGRLGWETLADSLAIISEPVLPVGLVLVLLPVLVLLGLLLAAGPAIAARRTKPAVVLRAE